MDLSAASYRRPGPEHTAVRWEQMTRRLRALATAGGLGVATLVADTALAQKPGGTLRMYHFDSPASLSLHEEVTFAALGPAIGPFNNLVMFQPHVAQPTF